MRSLEATLNKVLVDTSSDSRFNDRKKFKSIERNASQLAKLAHSLFEKPGQSPDQDMSQALIGKDFATEADYAASTLKAGHREYARVILNSIAGFCIACHTRTAIGPQFASSKVAPEVEALPPLAKGNYFVATRNFDRALAEYQKITQDSDQAIADPFAYERALRAGLSVAVRVKKNPDLGLRLVESVIVNSKSPYYMKAQALEWKKSLLEWKAEKTFDSKDPGKIFEEANRLVMKARAIQKFPADPSADLVYLRASGLLHEFLSSAPTGLIASNAYYLAGISYDVLKDYGTRDFSEFYYRSCISTSPYTEISKDCYRRYEESVYLGYTGSGGTYIPPEIRARLNRYEKLSGSDPSTLIDTQKM
ncbi:MAG: hypothetical protein H7301_03095 [Cryobacterium sp.]|nr:hypothetical protein [Oligoflexia bacterium]